ncbi:MAG: hypothetical protein ABW170_21980 [Candidatus Thiodiazotropha sp. L084R]
MKSIFILLAILLAACNSDYSHDLPNGYTLSRFYSGSSAITSPDSIVIVGPSKYGIHLSVSGKYVIGNLDAEAGAYGAPETPDRYFIVDTSSGLKYKELSYAVYSKRINDLSIRNTKLYRPNGLGLK